MRTPYGCRRNPVLRYGFAVAIAAVALATGCASTTTGARTEGAEAAERRPYESGETASSPAAGLGDPAAVAAAYVVASGSGGAAEEVGRVRALVTERFARAMGRASGDGGAVRVEQVFVPDGAPSPTADRRYVTVTGHRGDEPLQVSLRLVRVGGRWLVDEIFLF
ncbi:hypothetical protein ACFHYQ_08845 [Sphaerimonospora cavernae]|uniref:DUF4878 domain-containing protein n=1 Tax=Sphaerimonospora cavernae TaxID=1740611 RepID=A0ABV6U1R3_9ACTN